jgi:hypothetical protein
MKTILLFALGFLLSTLLLDKFLMFVLPPDCVYPPDWEAGRRRHFFQHKGKLYVVRCDGGMKG